MNRSEIIEYLILNNKTSINGISQTLGINRSNIYLWKKGKTKPKIDYINKLCLEAGLKIKWIDIDNIKIEEDEKLNFMKNTSEKIISLQDSTIKLQEEKIESLEKKIKTIKNTHVSEFDSVIEFQFQMSCDFEFSLSSLIPNITYREPCSNFNFISSRLGYTENELRNNIFSFNKKMNYKNHTIHKLRIGSEKKNMIKKAKSIITSLKNLENIIDGYNIKVPVLYLNKTGKTIHALNQYSINFIKSSCKVKIHFMKD
tara:strand:+ start:251 stop:1021 length:771 start_codon:yes stop_codon:yes gene_type:complete